MSTYGEIRHRVVHEAPGVALALVDGYLMDRYTAILDRLKWRRQAVEVTFDTVADTALYTLPATFKIFGSASIPAERIDLEKLSKAQLDQTAPGRPAASGVPRIVSLTFDSTPTEDSPVPLMQIELYPPPDDVYSVSVEGTAEAPTVSGTGTTLLPWLRPSALTAGAVADCMEHLENYTRAAAQEVKFEKYLGDMIRTECANRGPQKIRMAGWLTRDNLQRAVRSSSRTGPRLP